MRGGEKMGMAVVKSARWGGDGYADGEEWEVVLDCGGPERRRRNVAVKSVDIEMAAANSVRWCGDGYVGGEEWDAVLDPAN